MLPQIFDREKYLCQDADVDLDIAYQTEMNNVCHSDETNWLGYLSSGMANIIATTSDDESCSPWKAILAINEPPSMTSPSPPDFLYSCPGHIY